MGARGIMSQSQENTHIDDNLDREKLHILQGRFKKINQRRLLRLRSALNKQQQLILQALPLLFHSNHPVLPGYVSQQTPAGLANFRADEEQLHIGKRIARSFHFRANQPTPDILGIYVMGSVGTIAQSGRSDLDIWLCHRANLGAQPLEELKKKCEQLSAWAAKLHLEIHFFPMNADLFRDGDRLSMDSESSGSTQQLFLLDEFYRSAIHLGGRMPIWWFVPPQAEPQYNERVQTLLRNRFLRPQDVIDFGGMASFAASEYISAGIWQLYKAIKSPYKSLIKLLLLEAYASDQPNIVPLSLNFKQLVYRGVLDIDQLDSYLLSYQRIEQYLIASQQHSRLELARRCFYFKVNRALSKTVKHAHNPWQREALESLVEQWQWSQETLAKLDNRANWRAIEVSQERSILVAELNRSYQFLLDTANANRASRKLSGTELTVLGRKLQAVFERRPGKIEWLNPGISRDMSETNLGLRQHFFDETLNDHLDNTHDEAPSETVNTINEIRAPTWMLVAMEDNQQNVLHSSPNLVELLMWCHFNGICNSNTHFDLADCRALNSHELRKLLNVFQTWLPQVSEPDTHSEFQEIARPMQILLLLNLARESRSEEPLTENVHLDSNIDELYDPATGASLIQSLDLVTYNSWHELCCKRFTGNNALIEGINEYVHLCVPNVMQAPPILSVECFGEAHALSIAHRVRHLFDGIHRSCYSKANLPATRFIFELNKQYHCLQPYENHIETCRFDNKNFLIDYLGLAQAVPSRITLDEKTLQHDPLKAVFNQMKPPDISVIYRRFDFGWELFIADEQGSLQHLTLRGSRDFNPLISLHRFLRNVIKREILASNQTPPAFGVKPLNFFALTRGKQGEFHCTSSAIPSESKTAHHFEVKANAYLNQNNQVLFDFYCDDQIFSAHSLGEQLYYVVAQFIVSRRQSGQNYPVYLADLDLSLCRKQLCRSGRLQTSHYLRFKKKIERNLNESIGRVLHK